MKLNFDNVIKDGVEQIMENCQLAIGMTLKEAVEKQIPKRAISTYKENYKCPTCESYIDITDDDLYVYEIVPPEYCPNCGQRLDWGGTK